MTSFKSSLGGKKQGRTCVACKKVSDARLLLRVTLAPDNRVILDWRRNLGGRGAHVCINKECISRAVGKRLFNKPLKASGVYPSVDEFLERISDGLTRNLVSLLSSGQGGRKIAIGTDAVNGVMSKNSVYFLLVAEDAAKRDFYLEGATSRGIPARTFGSKELFGVWLNRRPVGLIGITERQLATAVATIVDRQYALL